MSTKLALFMEQSYVEADKVTLEEAILTLVTDVVLHVLDRCNDPKDAAGMAADAILIVIKEKAL